MDAMSAVSPLHERDVMLRNPRRLTDAWPLLALAVSACLLAATPSHAAAGPLPCAADAQSRALDFWLGHWRISDGERPSRATSVVSLELGECLVVENWSDSAGHRGENLFGYNLDSRTWSGMFADNRGHIHIFVQGTVGANRAEFDGRSRGPNGKDVLNRISIVREAADDIEQTWQQSADGGATWTTVFQGKYSRART
jgi:hypothetical protein